LLIMRNLRIRADFAVSAFDKNLAGSESSVSKAILYLMPHLDSLAVIGEGVVVMVLAFLLGYIATLLYLRQPPTNMLAYEGE